MTVTFWIALNRSYWYTLAIDLLFVIACLADTVLSQFIASKHTLYTDKRNTIKFINNNSSLANVQISYFDTVYKK
jgi:hypothetical protein